MQIKGRESLFSTIKKILRSIGFCIRIRIKHFLQASFFICKISWYKFEYLVILMICKFTQSHLSRGFNQNFPKWSQINLKICFMHIQMDLHFIYIFNMINTLFPSLKIYFSSLSHIWKCIQYVQEVLNQFIKWINKQNWARYLGHTVTVTKVKNV